MLDIDAPLEPPLPGLVAAPGPPRLGDTDLELVVEVMAPPGPLMAGLDFPSVFVALLTAIVLVGMGAVLLRHHPLGAKLRAVLPAWGKPTLEAVGAKLGLKPHGEHGEGLRGRVDGIEVEVMPATLGRTRFLVLVTCDPPMPGLGFEAEEDMLGGTDQAMGDRAFDRRVKLSGDGALLLAMLGPAERATVRDAVERGWSLGGSRWSRPAAGTHELAAIVARGVELARALAHVAPRHLDVRAMLESRYRYETEEEARVELLTALIAHPQVGEARRELLREGLTDRDTGVRLLCAAELGSIEILAAIVCDSPALRHKRPAMSHLARLLTNAPTEAGWAPLVERLLAKSRATWSAGDAEPRHLANVILGQPFPGRLRVARRWITAAEPSLLAAACRILAHEGEAADLATLAAVTDPPTLRELASAAATQLRARLVEGGAVMGGLSLSEAGGQLALSPISPAEPPESGTG